MEGEHRIDLMEEEVEILCSFEEEEARSSTWAAPRSKGRRRARRWVVTRGDGR
jgi:hypothetical protein